MDHQAAFVLWCQWVRRVRQMGWLLTASALLSSCSWLGWGDGEKQLSGSQTSSPVSQSADAQPDALQASTVWTYVPPQRDVTDPSNVVVAYLWDVEVQFGTLAQCQEIRRALEDMQTLSASNLQQARYNDDNGNAGQWDVLDLLHRYFVPHPAMRLEPELFYHDVQTPQAREVIGHTLADISCDTQYPDQGEPEPKPEAIPGW